MAPKDNIPPLEVLKQNESLEKVLARDREVIRESDCLPCRLMGAGAFMGLGVYSYYTGHKNLELNRAKILKSGSMFGMNSRGAGINGLAISFICLGMYRFFN